MKKIFFIAAALLMGVCAQAQNEWGATIGLNSSRATEIFDSSKGLEFIGATYRYRGGMGFMIQPSLLYHVKGGVCNIASAASTSLTMRYAEIPVSLQWGPNLLLCRPYVELVPFAGIALGGKAAGEAIDLAEFNTFEYGVGLGAGIDFRNYQFSIRYNWNRDTFADAAYVGEPQWRCITFSLTVFIKDQWFK